MTLPPAGPAVPAATPSPRRRRPSRLRGPAMVVCALAMVGIYLIWWTTYAWIHQNQRYFQLPAGQSSPFRGGTVTLLQLTRSDRLADSGGGQPQIADAHAVWVVAELQVLSAAPDPDKISCTVSLLGPQGRLWDTASPSVQRAAPFCDHDDIKPGQPYRFEAVFLVPERDADQLAGIALVDASGPARTPVLTSPA